MSVPIVVLAAGASRRLGEPKALARIAGRTALEHLVGAAHAAGSVTVYVVVGAHERQIRAALPDLREVLWVQSPDWKRGRSASILAGLSAAGSNRDVMIAPIDVPLVRSSTIRALLSGWREHGAPSRGWLAPFIQGKSTKRYGHPVVVGKDLLAEIDPDAPSKNCARMRSHSWAYAPTMPRCSTTWIHPRISSVCE